MGRDGTETSSFTRREFVRLVVVSSAAAALPLGCGGRTRSGPPFFTDEERTLLRALADYVIAPDRSPGAADLGAVDYIENLLTALEVNPPLIFAGGPYSGRKPFADMMGKPSGNAPQNDAAHFLPLSRYQWLAWKLRIYGSAAVSGGGPNDAVTGPVKGWRDLYRDGLAQLRQLIATAGSTHVDMQSVDGAWGQLPAELRDTVVQHVLEAMLAFPEYGGNRDLAGWRLIHIEGDVQPLGYSPFDYSSNTYASRSQFPVSGPEPGPDPDPMDDDTRSLLEAAVSVLGGKVFY
ncbi:MAG: hypothetical protein ACXWC5_26145 [Burkholderiales bacterium]